jgi:hypothetical protein
MEMKTHDNTGCLLTGIKILGRTTNHTLLMSIQSGMKDNADKILKNRQREKSNSPLQYG